MSRDMIPRNRKEKEIEKKKTAPHDGLIIKETPQDTQKKTQISYKEKVETEKLSKEERHKQSSRQYYHEHREEQLRKANMRNQKRREERLTQKLKEIQQKKTEIEKKEDASIPLVQA